MYTATNGPTSSTQSNLYDSWKSMIGQINIIIKKGYDDRFQF